MAPSWLLLVLVMLAACGPATAPRVRNARAAQVRPEAAFDARELAARLFTEVAREERENLVVAPGSALQVTLAAHVLAPSARHSPLRALVAADPDGAARALSAWPRLEGERASTRLEGVAFVDPAHVTSDQRSALGIPMVSTPWGTDPAAASSTIAAWQRDHDLELDAIPVTPGRAALVLSHFEVSALWYEAFYAEETVPRDFDTGDGIVQVDMMHDPDLRAGYWADDTVVIAAVPAGVEDGARFDSLDALTMMFVLPREGHPLSELEHTLDGATLSRWSERLELEYVSLTVPRFAFRSRVELSRQLAADESAMTELRAVQQTDVAIDEIGVRARSGTQMEVVVRGENPEVVLNRPFLFILHDHRTHTDLLIGRVVDPSAAPSSPP